MRIIEEIQLNYKDVLIRPKRSTLTSRSEISLLRTFKFKYGNQALTCHPIIASNMDCTGTFEMAKSLAEENCMTALHKFFPAVELNAKFKDVIDNTWYSLGMRQEDLDKLAKLTFTPKFINIDVPNGYLQKFVEHCASVREKYPDAVIMAGNVSTGEMVEELIVNGKVDIVKIFIGPGSGCLTQYKTGVGQGTISSIIECSDAAHGLNGHVCADGGIKSPGDVAKAFGAGSDFVMIGGFFTGTDECSGEWEYAFDKKINFSYYGMSSAEAMTKYYGGVDKYRTAEGKVVTVKYKGPVKDAVQDILGGLRSTGTYIGARCLKDFPKCTTFIKVI